MNVGPWAVYFGALVPLHESHSASGRLRNYKYSSAVTSQKLKLSLSNILNFNNSNHINFPNPYII